MFDLPVVKHIDRTQATKFRNFLLNDGYTMLQYSIYTRICNGTDAVNKHINRLQNALPEKGSIRVLVVTDKQYAEMKFMLGKKNANEKKIISTQYTEF